LKVSPVRPSAYATDRAEDRIDGDAVDRFRIALRDFLDLHAALRGRHDHREAETAVEGDAEVELLVDVERFLDQDLAHDAPLGAGLVRDEGHPEDLLRQLAGFVRVVRELDAAALAAAAGVDLRLDDDAAAELLRGLPCFVGIVDDDSARRRHSVAAKNLFCLILVNLHRAASSITCNQAT
jgi:hypothetical protein